MEYESEGPEQSEAESDQWSETSSTHASIGAPDVSRVVPLRVTGAGVGAGAAAGFA